MEPLTLAEGRRLYEEYINRPVVTGGPQPSTKKKYRSHLDKLIANLESQRITTWNQVTPKSLNNYAAFLKAGGPPNARPDSYADKSILNELTFARQLVKWLIANGNLRGMGPINLKVRKAENQRPYCWRTEEVAAMIEHCAAHLSLRWLGDVIIALACTGLRIAELAGLRWSDVNLDSAMLILTDETNRARGGQAQRRVKSGRSRSFPIHPHLLNVFKARTRTGKHIFLGPRSGRLKPDTVRRSLIRHGLKPLEDSFPTAEDELGFRDGRLHSFRHFFCSVCANSGVPEQMIMAWLGHRDSEMVRHYYHLHDGEARRRMNQIDFLGGAAGGPLAAGKNNVKEESPATEDA